MHKTGSEPPESLITIVSKSDSWEYLECHFVKWLVDDRPLDLGDFEHNGSIGSGYVLEFVTGRLKPTGLEAMTKAQKIEYKICNDVFKLTESEMADVRGLKKTFDEAIAKAK